jgi:hypothetical protein
VIYELNKANYAKGQHPEIEALWKYVTELLRVVIVIITEQNCCSLSVAWRGWIMEFAMSIIKTSINNFLAAMTGRWKLMIIRKSENYSPVRLETKFLLEKHSQTRRARLISLTAVVALFQSNNNNVLLAT